MKLASTLAAVVVCSLAAPALADTLVVLNKDDATATLIEPRSGAVRATVPTGAGPHEVAVSPDGKTAVVANYGQRQPGNTLTVIDLERARTTATIDLGEHRRPHGIEYLPDGTCVAVTTEDSGSVLIVHVARRAVVAAIETRGKVSHMLALRPDGRRAYTANIGSGDVSVIDLAARRFVKTIATGAGAEGIALTVGGKQLWVTNRAADTVTVIDTASDRVIANLPSASFPIRVEMTPDGKHALVSNAKSGDLAVFDVASRNEIRRVKMGAGHLPIGVLARPDGAVAYVANTRANTISVVDLKTWRVTRTLSAGTTPDGMAYVRSGPREVRVKGRTTSDDLDNQRPRAQILAAFRADADAIRRCYTSRRAVRPDLSGRVDVRFAIAASGAVSDVKIHKSTLADPAAEACIARRVSAFSFPPAARRTTVSFPLIFAGD